MASTTVALVGKANRADYAKPRLVIAQLDRLAPQVQSAKQLRVGSNDDGLNAHRDRHDTHREIKPPTDEKT
ncbi:MAG: hypothetical protein ACRETS_01620, partial [Steroidobacteraceae bacterium]